MRGHLEASDFGHLQFDEAVDEVVVEHAAGLEERAILVEVLERFAQRTADRRDGLQLFLRQIVQILVSIPVEVWVGLKDSSGTICHEWVQTNGMTSVLVFPHTVQVKVMVPSFVVVAGSVTSPSFQSCSALSATSP